MIIFCFSFSQSGTEKDSVNADLKMINAELQKYVHVAEDTIIAMCSEIRSLWSQMRGVGLIPGSQVPPKPFPVLFLMNDQLLCIHGQHTQNKFFIA